MFVRGGKPPRHIFAISCIVDRALQMYLRTNVFPLHNLKRQGARQAYHTEARMRSCLSGTARAKRPRIGGDVKWLSCGTDFIVADVIRWRDIYDLLEGTTDKCEDVAGIIEGIVLKHG